MNGPGRRYDGAPAPPRNAGVTAGDMKAAAREAKENAECDHCGHDDYDDLKRVAKTYIHDCPRHQAPDPRPILLCDDCREDHDPEAEFRERMRERDKVIAIYECGIGHAAEEPDPDMVDVGDGEMVEAPWSDPTEQIAVRCDCGAEIDEICY